MERKRVLLSIGKIVYGIVATVVILWLFLFVAGATLKIYPYATIGSDLKGISVLGSTTIDGRYASIQIADRADRSNVILEPKEWDELLVMWQKAKTRQSGIWQEMGTITESDISNPSKLRMEAGPGIRFAIIDDGLCLRYDIAPQDFAWFEKALQRAKKHFVDGNADDGLTPYSPTWRDALGIPNETLNESIPRATSAPDCR